MPGRSPATLDDVVAKLDEVLALLRSAMADRSTQPVPRLPHLRNRRPGPLYKEGPAERQPGQPWPLKDAACYLGVSAKMLTRGRDAGTVSVLNMGKLLYIADDELNRLMAVAVKTKADG